MKFRNLGDFMVKRGGSVDPKKFEDEIFELLSIPAFDKGMPDILVGGEIGSAKKIVEPYDVLLSKIVPHIRRCWVVPIFSKYRQIASGEWIQFRSDEFVPDYVRHFLISDPFHSLFMKTVTGVGGSLLRAKPAEVAKIKIPLPPLDDQKRIAHLLGKVEGLIARRKQHLQQLDDLLKSVFLEMFGDPVRNEKGWPKRELGKVIKIKHGFAFKSEFFKDEGPFVLLTPGNFFEKGGFRDRGDKQKYYTGEAPEEYILDKGALLLAMTEQAPGLLGSPLIVPEANLFLHNQRLGLVMAKETIQTRFLFHLFNQKSIRQIIHSKATGTKVRHTSPTKLESIVVGYPAINRQNQFAAIVKKVESFKSHYQQSLADLETLYGALSQQAFKGELDLSRVPLPSITGDLAVELPSIEGEMHGKVEKIAYELPAPGDVKILKSTEGRRELLEKWLEAYLGQLGDTPFSAQHFMETAQQKLYDLVEDETPVWGAAEYDQVKDWIFEALEQGRLTQNYDDAYNRVQLKAVGK